MNRLISIIIPTFAGADVINRAVDSVLKQSYTDIEVIVVDDNGVGSDNQIKTEKAMLKYSNDTRVRYIVHATSKHGSAARNTGAVNSKGYYLAFLDDDDEYDMDNLHRHIDVFKNANKNVGLTYCGMKLVRDGFEDEVIMPVYEGNILFDFLMSRIRIGSSLLVVKREVYDDVNGFDESFKRHQDWEFLTRILQHYTVAKVDYPGVIKYVINRNYATKPEIYEAQRIYFLEKMGSIIAKLTKNEQKQIYNNHYYQIAKEYFKAKKIVSWLKWMFKLSNPIKYVFKMLSDGNKYFFRHK